MEELKLRYKSIQQALCTLKEGLDEIEIPIVDRPKAYKLMRDGVMQRFEYSLDSFWKYLKMYFESVHQMIIESPSPNKVFRLSSKLNLLTDIELNTLLDCVTDRNLTSHTYNEIIVEKIYEHIPLYHATMKAVLDRLSID